MLFHAVFNFMETTTISDKATEALEKGHGHNG